MIVTRKSARAKSMAEGSPSYSVFRSLQGEPTVNARLMDPSCKFLYVEFSISELRDMLKVAENANVVKEWDREQIGKRVRIIDKGFELPAGEQLIETYRGYHITKRPGMARCSIWSAKGAPAGSFIETHEAARKLIDGYISDEEAAVEREALPYSFAAPRTVEGHRYSVEQQQDRKWAVFCGQGFVKGGFMDRTAAVNDARKRVKADQETGVPVIAEIGGQI